jgi:hypothetical protein
MFSDITLLIEQAFKKAIIPLAIVTKGVMLKNFWKENYAKTLNIEKNMKKLKISYIFNHGTFLNSHFLL